MTNGAQFPVVIDQEKFDPLRFDGVLWRRVMAYVIDLLIIIVLTLPISLLLLLGGMMTFGLLWIPLSFLWLGLNVGYYVLLVGGSQSSTWGQRMMGLEMFSLEGGSPNALQALIQIALFYTSVGIATPLILLIGPFNAKGRLLHDMLSGLVAVKRG